MFVPGTQVYWAEFKVMFEALGALGYAVEVRSSHTNAIPAYSADGDIAASAAGIAGGSYATFKVDFLNRFGVTFSDAWAPIGTVTTAGRIQDVSSLTPYVALVLVGGLGALEYRYDGTYSGAEQQAAATALNTLATQALTTGKPILAQCHAGTLPAFFRVPGTAGGPGNLGASVLQGRSATAYHLSDGDTAAQFTALGVTYRVQESVVVDGPLNVTALPEGAFKIITSRDWYPQTVAHAAATLHQHLRSTPPPARLHGTYSVLLLHGGPLDVANCTASNRANDVPCNYGTSPATVLPADYTHVRSLLLANSTADDVTFTVNAVDLRDAGTAFDPSSAQSVTQFASGFDAVLFFKHWNTFLPASLQQGLARYVDDGGGLVALHHGLYNDLADGRSKAELVALFGAESNGATFSARNPNTGPFNLYNVNVGHFITAFGVPYDMPAAARQSHITGAPLANAGPLIVPTCGLTDELYLNMAFAPGLTFGPGVNQVQSLFANSVMTTGTQAFTSGFARVRDVDGNGTAGRIVFLQAGERRTSFQLPNPNAQAVRNALVWAAQ